MNDNYKNPQNEMELIAKYLIKLIIANIVSSTSSHKICQVLRLFYLLIRSDIGMCIKLRCTYSFHYSHSVFKKFTQHRSNGKLLSEQLW